MNKIIKFLFFLLIFLILLNCLLMYKNSFSTFFSKITGKSDTAIAEPIFAMENSEKKVLNDTNTEVDYYFTIKNYENGKKSQVDLKYFIEISPKQDSTIVLTLYKDNKMIPLKNQKTDYIEIKQESNQTHEYRLNIKYDKESPNAIKDIQENVFIKASAIQS